MKETVTFQVDGTTKSVDWEAQNTAMFPEMFSKSYSSVAGVDVKVCFLKDGKETTIAEAQAISCELDLETGKTAGSLILIMFDQERLMSEFGNSLDAIHLKAATEYGHLAEMWFRNVKFKKFRWGIAIDDIISEFHYTFEAEKVEPWKTVPPVNAK